MLCPQITDINLHAFFLKVIVLTFPHALGLMDARNTLANYMPFHALYSLNIQPQYSHLNTGLIYRAAD